MAKLGKQNLSIAHQRQKYVSKLTTRSNLSYPTFNIFQFSRFSWFNGPMFGSPKQLNLNVSRKNAGSSPLPLQPSPPKKMAFQKPSCHFLLRKTRETPNFPGPSKLGLGLPNRLLNLLQGRSTFGWWCRWCRTGRGRRGGHSHGLTCMMDGVGWGGIFIPCSFGLKIQCSPF